MKATTKISICIAAMSVVLAGCTVQTQQQPDESNGAAQQQIVQQQQKPTTAKVDRRDIIGYRLLNGTIYMPPNAEANVMTTQVAPVKTVDVRVGDHVAKGQVLMTLDKGAGDYYSTAKSTYDAALLAYNQAVEQYEQPVQTLKSQLAQAREAERAARQASEPGGDATALQSATDNRKAIESQLQTAETQAKSSELSYKQQLDQARITLNDAKSDKNAATITSPISGTVIALMLAPGQQASGKTAVATIADLQMLKIKANVDPDDAAYVKPGGSVAIVLTDYPDRKLDGRITKVDVLPAEQDGKSRYAATIDFRNTQNLVKPDSKIKSVGVIAGRRSGVLAVPVDAVAKDASGKPVVKLQQDGSWKVVPVTVGMSDGNFVEIKSGLNLDDIVQVVPGQGQWLLSTNMTTTP